MHTTAELRWGFREFFESKGHAFRPSASLVPREDDHSTLLVSAGMQPLMPYFLGREQPPAPLLTTVQKVFRTPDIDEVGLDGFHLTFFEMLGNFSFGQYFKEGAIELAWEFMFGHMKLDPDRIWVTVFAGDPELGLGEDRVAIELWERIGMPPERIIRLPRADNFWSVGGPGPCGPDSEIFYDWGEGVGCGRPECAPGCGCERFLEFWNLVFMEYELHVDGTLTPLPQQNIDTGMGLERAARILQGVDSVYDTDGYQAIMNWLARESGVAYGDSPEATKAHRILADHGRGMTFLAADGVAPSNEGRGYVMRRIMRRAILQGTRIGLETPFLSGLADVVVEQMGEAYPELPDHRAEIHRILDSEEERFSDTLARGIKVFEELARAQGITGEHAFTLAATYGFPIELTVELAEERGQTVDVDEFRRLMEGHREISRTVPTGKAIIFDAASFSNAAGFETDFIGWEKTEVLTQIGALEELGDGTFLAKLRESPFYAEGGGQITDQGWIEKNGSRADLGAAFRFGEDQALLFRGEGFAAGDRVKAVVPWKVRFPTMANHTGTHLLHKALQETLGDHVRQAGSAVRQEKLRFDFTHPQALTPEERGRVEELVNQRIFENLPVHAFLTPIEEARNLGAMMLFGEKYGDIVRVVEIPGFSRELCGGTHVRSTAEIGAFVILSESSVGSGVRRIEAVTSGAAFAFMRAQAAERDELAAELERARKETKKQAPAAGPDVVEERRNKAGDVEVIVMELGATTPEDMLQLSDRLMQQNAPAAVILGSRDNGRVHLLVNLDRSLEQRGLDAVKVVREAAALVGGGGGGRPTMAQAGGRDPDKLPEALERAERTILAALS
jgi:alanyl-tRNA synthetase